MLQQFWGINAICVIYLMFYIFSQNSEREALWWNPKHHHNPAGAIKVIKVMAVSFDPKRTNDSLRGSIFTCLQNWFWKICWSVCSHCRQQFVLFQISPPKRRWFFRNSDIFKCQGHKKVKGHHSLCSTNDRDMGPTAARLLRRHVKANKSSWFLLCEILTSKAKGHWTFRLLGQRSRSHFWPYLWNNGAVLLVQVWTEPWGPSNSQLVLQLISLLPVDTKTLFFKYVCIIRGQ